MGMQGEPQGEASRWDGDLGMSQLLPSEHGQVDEWLSHGQPS